MAASILGTLALFSACEERIQAVPPVALPDGAVDGPLGPVDGPDAPPPLPPLDALPSSDAPPCTPATCDQGLWRYCGTIGDGCGRIINCGDCMNGQICGGGGTAGICGGGPNCQPITCAAGAGSFCGMIGDGCGRTLDCGACANGGTCGGGGIANLCGGPPGCVPLTCQSAGGKYCGRIGDNCGGMLDCGDCPAGQLCGGAGTPNVCGGDPTCMPLTCDNAGGRFCGVIGDGCGKTLDCGACPGDQICGGAGAANVCGGGPSCVPRTCQQPTGKYCGQIGDGCGKTLDCGGCAAGDTCGGSGIPGVCGNPMGVCTGLCMQQMMCPGGGSTVLTGTVVAPTPPQFGAPDPIYNAIVYVPNGPVQPFGAGVFCGKCDAEVTGNPLVYTTTGADGKFTLQNVPVGTNIPLVIQLGRWRRQVVIPNVPACQTTLLPTELTRFPRNKAEGDIPKTAIATGRVDTLECVLRKVGIDDAEFTHPSGNGRIHLYRAPVRPGASAPGGQPQVTYNDLVGAPAGGSGTNRLNEYDMVVLPCQGAEIDKDSTQAVNLRNYANAGGRLFTTHYSYTWLYNTDDNGNPAFPFQGTVNWRVNGQGSFSGNFGTRPPNPFTATIDQSFARGAAFAQWMVNLNASPALGEIVINDGRHDVTSVIPPTQRWIHGTNANAGNSATLQHFTFDTELGKPADQQCGRVLFSNFHVADIADGADFTFPGECQNTPLTAQERALEFMFFDLASCIQTPMPPPPPPAPPATPPAVPPTAPVQPPAAPPAAPQPPPPAPPPPPIIP